MFLNERLCFVHIPRTSGISITTALQGALPDAKADTEEHRHDYVREIRKSMGMEAWRKLFRFSVIRSPWEIVASWYRLAKRDLEAMNTNPVFAKQHTTWIDYLKDFAADQSFASFIDRDILGGVIGCEPGGFWRTWCCAMDGSDIGVQPFRFEKLTEDWPRIAACCGCPGLELPCLNSTAHDPAPWTSALVQIVGHYCRDDVGRFGFRPPVI